jgi:hypothetical protein
MKKKSSGLLSGKSQRDLIRELNRIAREEMGR